MEIVDRIRQAANILEIVASYTTLKKRGRKFIGLCPFHSEKDPSFTVDEEKQLFHCFGCGTGGDVFSLVMEKENISFPEAIKYLAEKYRIPLPQQSKLSPEVLKLEEKLFKINEMALAFFRKNLFNTKEGAKAVEYLEKRGLSEKTFEELKLGYALNSWNAAVSHFKEMGVAESLLDKAGLAMPGRKNGGLYDRFRGRIIFPIFNLTGKVLAFGGRTIIEADPKYLNSPETPVYSKGKHLYGLNITKEFVRDKGELILVEGYMDFVSLYQSGIRNCAASLGTALTPHQVSLAMRFAPRLVINYDGDAAGRSATLRALSISFEKGIQTQVVLLPPDSDPDSYVRRNGPDGYLDLISKSIPGLRFLIDALAKPSMMKTAEEKAKAASALVREIEKIPDSVVRSEYLREASEYLNIEESLFRSLARQKPAETAGEAKETLLAAEKRLIRILIEDPSFLPLVFSTIKEDDYSDLTAAGVFKFFRDSFEGKKEFSFQDLQQAVGPKLSSLVSRLLLEKTPPATAEEVRDCLDALRKFSLQKRQKDLQQEIGRTEKSGNKTGLPSLLRQQQATTQENVSLSLKRNEPK